MTRNLEQAKCREVVLLGIEADFQRTDVIEALSQEFGAPTLAVESWLHALPWVLVSGCTLDEAERTAATLTRSGAICRVRESGGGRARTPSSTSVVARLRLSSRPAYASDEIPVESIRPASHVSVAPARSSRRPRRTSDLASAELEVVTLGNTPSELLHLKDSRREPEADALTQAVSDLRSELSEPGRTDDGTTLLLTPHQDEYTPRPMQLDPELAERIWASSSSVSPAAIRSRRAPDLSPNPELFTLTGAPDPSRFAATRAKRDALRVEKLVEATSSESHAPESSADPAPLVVESAECEPCSGEQALPRSEPTVAPRKSAITTRLQSIVFAFLSLVLVLAVIGSIIVVAASP